MDTVQSFLPSQPSSTSIIVSATGVGERETGKGRVYVFVLGQKGVLLPQDVAFKAEEVGFLRRKRSQNRGETPCSQHFLSTGHHAAERAAGPQFNTVGLMA